MKTVLIAQFKHETNSFNPNRTTLEDYRRRAFYPGAELPALYRGSKSELGAFLEVLEAREDIRVVPAVDANACPAGFVTRDTFETIRDMILDAAKAEGPVDALLLSLHGAMITVDTEDGEGLLLTQLRAALGDALPIVVTLDYHANMTETMAEKATALFPARYYPHTDFYERGLDAARMLLDVLDGRAHPTAALRKLPMIMTHLPTAEEPLKTLVDMVEAETGKGGVHYTYFTGGFSRADISVAGSAVYCVTENDPALARARCDRYADWVLERLEQFHISPPEPAAAVREAMAFDGLTVLADGADNPGSGAMGDATELYHELLRQGARNVAGTIWDPEVAAQAAAAGIGATIRVRLGGKSDPIVGKPIEAEAYVKRLSDGIFPIKGPMQQGVRQLAGLTAVLVFDGVTMVVTSNRLQTFDAELFRSNGVEPLDFQIVVVKSVVHFKAAWRALTERLVVLDLPNVSPLDETRIPFQNVTHPIFPLDPADAVRAAVKA